MIRWIIGKLRERRERKRKAEEARQWNQLRHRALQHHRREWGDGEDFHAERGDVD